MKYLVDIELTGALWVDAETAEEAAMYAEHIGIDQLKDCLLHTKVRVIERQATNGAI